MLASERITAPVLQFAESDVKLKPNLIKPYLQCAGHVDVRKLFLISFACLVFMAALSANYAAAQEAIPSPLEQTRMGVEPSHVQCNGGLQLIIRSENGVPACVKPSTADVLSQRIMAIIVGPVSAAPVPEPEPIVNDTQTEAPQNIVDANNRFMLDFYSKTSTPGDNSFFSPWSVLSAFSVLYEGARGQTANEISSAFYLPSDDARRDSFESMQSGLNANGSGYELSNANALWIKQGFDVKDDFVNTARKYYGGEVSLASFPADESRIDSWVENKTNHKIKDLVKGATDDLTRLVITNAVYFKGTWETQFNANQTREDDFVTSPGNSVKIQMMSQKSHFGYAETDDLQVLSMPYKGDRLSMLVLLPKGNGLETVEKSLTAEQIKNWQDSLHKSEVTVFMPKFNLTTSYDLTGTMNDLGIKSAFDPNAADLSGISDDPLYVGAAIHKAFVTVNEEGTEAAAATGIVVQGTSAQVPISFRADHPFVFLIQDNESGLILFMGKVVDPTL